MSKISGHRPLTYDRAVTERNGIENAIREEQQRHSTRMRELGADLSYANRVIAAHESGLVTADDAAIAMRVLQVRWNFGFTNPPDRLLTNEVREQTQAVIRDLQEGAPGLADHYFGVKAYEGWTSQKVTCAYGFGPSHGNVWFSIALAKAKDSLTEEERLACIRWLRAMLMHPDVILGDQP